MIVAFIQARMSSSRFNKKVLKTVLGRPMLELEIERVQQCKRIDRVVVVTSTSLEDQQIVHLCGKINVDVFCGSLDNVLDRFYQAARKYHPDHIVRLTGDCPLIDPDIVDAMVQLYLEKKCDYATNCMPPTFPDGLDAEIFSYEILEQARKEASLPSHLEHISLLFEEQPKRFKIENLACHQDLSAMRWTVDEPEDLEFVRAVFEDLYQGNPKFGMNDVLNLVARKPALALLNKRFMRNEGLAKSKEKDKAVKISIIFRVDADEKLGLGHLSRCRSLMKAMADAVPCEFTVLTNNPDVVRKFLSHVNFNVHAVTDMGRLQHADVVIIDVPHLAEQVGEDLCGGIGNSRRFGRIRTS